MTLMWLLYVMHRFFSGVRNGMMYDGRKRAYSALMWPLTGILATLGIAAYNTRFLEHWPLPRWIITTSAIVAFGLCMASTYMPVRRLERNERFPASDIHLWTAVEQVMLSALFCFWGWQSLTAALLAVYPGVLLQKITINLFSGLRWNYNGTDDPSGATYGIPSLGIKIRRTPFPFRIGMAAISIFLLFLCRVYEESVRQMWETAQRLFL